MKKGFTLIELLVVLAIIGILAAMIIASLSGARARARDATRKSDLRQLKLALEQYYQDNNESYYGTSGNSCGAGTGLWPDSATDPLNSYIRTMPNDPLNTGTNCYTYTYIAGPPSSYTLTTNLERLATGETNPYTVQPD